MFLIDTNIWLELLLEQEKADEVCEFFLHVEARLLAITEFSLYSIGIILTRLKKHDLLDDFYSDTIEDSGVGIVRLNIADLKQISDICKKFQLDFDDAYQYFASVKYDMTLVSFDSDFRRMERRSKTPSMIMSEDEI
jgi:predicted nucleic acid-binding protein